MTIPAYRRAVITVPTILVLLFHSKGQMSSESIYVLFELTNWDFGLFLWLPIPLLKINLLQGTVS